MNIYNCKDCGYKLLIGQQCDCWKSEIEFIKKENNQLIKAGTFNLRLGARLMVIDEENYQVLIKRVKELEEENKKLESAAKMSKEFLNDSMRRTRLYISECEELKRDLLLKEIPYQRLVGEFEGYLSGIISQDVPEDLKERLKLKIKELESIKELRPQRGNPSEATEDDENFII